MWEAKITEISELDSSGMFEIKFDVYLDGAVKYPGLVRRGNDKSILVDEVKNTLREYKRKAAEVGKFKVGDIITIS